MKLRYVIVTVMHFCFLGLFCSSEYSRNNRDCLFQIATIESLLQGNYRGFFSIEQMKRYGNFGLGTFHNLDGEMVVLDRKIYQVKYDGQINLVHDSVTTPFSVVTFFESDFSEGVKSVSDLKMLKEQIDGLMESKQMIYGVRIDGFFKHVKTRSVPAQQKPYPKLADVIKNQVIFDFENIRGTIVGFWMPSYMDGLNVSGYHLHFISEDKRSGGHLLDCTIGEGIIKLDQTHLFSLVLPPHLEFLNLNLDENEEQSALKLE